MNLAVSFIIPWFDPSGSTGGGAEMLCRAYAERLAAAGHDVEVLTTCARDHDADWYTNALAAGRVTVPAGYAVERFPVRRGDRGRFLDLNRRILHGQPLSYREERSFLENSIQSDALAQAVAARAGRRLLIAIPYLTGTSWRSVMENPGQVIQWPCLHDEGYARLKLIAEAARRSAGLIFNSAAEAELAQRLYAPTHPTAIAGAGIDLPEDDEPYESTPPDRTHRTHGTHRMPLSLPGFPEPWFVCLGRQSPEKGTHHLCALFARFAAGRDGDARLVLAGKGSEGIRDSEAIRNLGFVGEAEKDALLRRAVAVIVPSVRESFSLVLLEALARGTPVLVNGACEVTRRHVADGQCGLWYRNGNEFEECAALLLENPGLRRRLGQNGREYVRRNFGWDQRLAALTGFLKCLNKKTAQAGRPAP